MSSVENTLPLLTTSESFGLSGLKLNTSTSSSSSSSSSSATEEKIDTELLYDLLRRSDSPTEPIKYLSDRSGAESADVNTPLKNGDTILCLACHKGYQELVRYLVENSGADVNLCRTSNTNNNTSQPSSSYSTFTPTITISARRHSRLVSGNAGGLKKPLGGDSPLSVCIKYGFEAIAEYLIEKNASISGVLDHAEQGVTTTIYADFERSPLQEAIRLNRTRIVEKMLQSMFERDDLQTIEWVFAKRYDILRQVLMTENLETIKVILPNIIENRRIDGELGLLSILLEKK